MDIDYRLVELALRRAQLWKYVETFKKQNLNFIEILFSPFVIINPLYKDVWNLLVENREEIGRYNPFRAIKSMKGIALEKFTALEHPYPSKIHLIEKYRV